MFEYVVGLNVVDEDLYAKYRSAMTPILTAHGGNFGYEFKIDKVLKSLSSDPINRVFTIFFPDKQTADKFFANPEYAKAKETYFESAVTSTTIISSYSR